MTFDEYFMALARTVASKSKDPSTKVGCIIVGEDNEIRSTGWNGLPRKVMEYEGRLKRPEKYKWTIHAEANAIANAARSGISLKNCRAYVTHCPCSQCTGLLIQAGIVEIIWPEDTSTVGDFNIDVSETMMNEADVENWIMKQ